MAASGLCSVPGVSQLCSAAGGVVSSVGKDFIATAAADAAQGADSLLQTLATSWTEIPTPTGSDCALAANGAFNCVPQSASSGGAGGAIQFIQGDLRFITLFVGVAGIIFAASRMAFLRRGEPMREAASGLLRLVLVSAMGLAFISIMAQAGDSFSAYVLKSTPSSRSGDLAQATTLFKLSSGGTTAIAPFLLLILGILAIIATLVQLFLIVVRGALLVVIAGVWPLSAAASMTGGGSSFFKKTTGYLVAFLIYKPAAAVVYALAFYLIQNPPANQDPVIPQIEGVTLIILATLTLPALLKFVVPAVASVGGISTAEVAGAGLALATGAAAIVATGGASVAAGAGAAGASGGGGAAGLAGPAGAGLAGRAGGAGMSAGSGGGPPAGSAGGVAVLDPEAGPAPGSAAAPGGSPGGGAPSGAAGGGTGGGGSGSGSGSAQGLQHLGRAAPSGLDAASGASPEQPGGEEEER